MTVAPSRQARAREQAALARERMLDAAEEAFGRSGYRETSLRQIADAAGLSVGALYLHLDGKEELLRAVLDRRSDVLMRTIRAFVEADGPGIDRLAGLASAEVEFYRTHRDFDLVMWRLFSAGMTTLTRLSEDIAQGYTTVMRLEAELVRQGQRDGTVRAGDAEALARLLAALVGAYRAIGRDAPTVAGAAQDCPRLPESDFTDIVRRAFASDPG
ncbi:TetR/AcrR family transcriptional regulator [Frankia sp. AgKG'84/4]|uniref:TetR/AcrR family transcriptional regulator n=1 Tax=Frankia sp. AgKG'84/4 TaxID=573490 RepID=UPI00200CC6CF|nr:TetR/AcrR family transcriptional regulator [Frankia sp. AgKG'84/4]MCL9794000.1 TetR/AcrR family transcriptional regulator [Frankia sp. AgKG'84/4]